eukprot:TRINITY_DN29669_c0_g1_i1.p2 TRINITY_DN29669_c0_g1~~TRINITY_DN29669_c0_g1_i1.p2  ORF type:complete len:254 (+),score=74.24 TRINITY_DN29669_c0_g1_i1:765-1526(+)
MKKQGDLECKELAVTQAALETAEKEAYRPLMENSAAGSRGEAQLKKLRKAGKAFGFHEALLISLPAILRKQPDRRVTFDGIALRQVEAEFDRRRRDMDAAGAAGRKNAEEHTQALQDADAAHARAREAHGAAITGLGEAEAQLVAGKQALAVARRRLQTFPADRRRAEREAAAASARLLAFRRGPLAAFAELRALTSPPSPAQTPQAEVKADPDNGSCRGLPEEAPAGAALPEEEDAAEEPEEEASTFREDEE